MNIIEDAIEFAKMQFKVEDKEKRRSINIERKYFTSVHIKTDTRLMREIVISIVLKVANFLTRKGTLQIELKSVNSRYLDFQFRICEELRVVEPALRELFSARLTRGKLECRLGFAAATSRSQPQTINSDLLERLNAIQQGSMMPQDPPANEEDWPLYQMQLNRLDQMVRSALVLAVTDCVTELHKESPI